MIERQFGNYEILRELGRGGMGVVYKAHEATLNRAVALKMLPENIASRPGFVDRFLREARAVAQLNHPNVVTIYNIGEQDGHHYIAMEFVKGESLADLIRRRGPMELRAGLEVARQVAGALDAAHRVGIIHRDIKPHNIMLDEGGRAKVMDFGIARILTDDGGGALTRTGESLGTPAYMSPEQCRGHELDGRTDIYALGVVIYEILTGRMPFESSTPIASIEKILFEPVPNLAEDLPSAPEEIVALVAKCLAKNREDRYASGAELERALREWLYPGSATLPRDVLSGMITSINEPRPQSTAGETKPTWIAGLRSQRRPRWLMPAAGLGALVVLGALALTLTRSGSDAPPEPLKKITAALPAVTPAPPTPLEWTEAPEPGAMVWEDQLHVSWRVSDGAILEGFRLGLNATDPLIETNNTSHTFQLAEAGPQKIVIEPVGPGGESGSPLFIEFNYLPNGAPTLIASLPRRFAVSGAAVEIQTSVTDPENQLIKIEARVDGGPWSEIQAGGQPLAGLADGDHTIEIRAVDEPGRFSEIWSGAVTLAPPADMVERAMRAAIGLDGRIDEPAANELTTLAAETGEPVARMWLAWLMHWGRAGFDQDQPGAAAIAGAALPDAIPLAEGGSAMAQFLAGAALELGMGVERDSERGAGLLKLAAEQGHTQAMSYLGWMELTGRGGKTDQAAAAEWFRKAAELGDTQAMNNLGNVLMGGKGAKKDEKQAAEWFQKGADLGSSANLNSLGAMYLEGKGVEKDRDKGLELLKLAARLGNKTAQDNLEKLKLTW